MRTQNRGLGSRLQGLGYQVRRVGFWGFGMWKCRGCWVQGFTALGILRVGLDGFRAWGLAAAGECILKEIPSLYLNCPN